MLLWVIFAILTAIVLSVILYPLAKTQDGAGAERGAFDATVYKDQLLEVDADVARGLLSKEDAEAARVEISRRLLASAGSGEEGEKEQKTALNYSVPAVLASAILLPFLSLGLYLHYGSPGLPDQPRAARLQTPPDQQRLDELVARVEDRLRENPHDGTGWDVIAPVYLRQGRFDDASEAFARAIKLKGESKERLFGLGEALRLSNDGIVSEEARQAFERAVKLDENYVPALYRLAVAKEQDGRFGEAVTAWKDILQRLPDGVAWRTDAEQRLAAAEARAAGKPAPAQVAERPQSGGPTKEQIEAVRQMKPEDRMAMINQMVSGLAERLKEDASDAQGWLKLVRAYSVLGRQDDAKKALKDARQGLAENADALAALTALAKQLGLEG